MIRHCPLCGLNFRGSSELVWHARDDHQPVRVDERRDHVTRYLHSGRPPLPVYHLSI